MRQRVGHVLVTCTLATFGGGCTATSQVFNTKNEMCYLSKNHVPYPQSLKKNKNLWPHRSETIGEHITDISIAFHCSINALTFRRHSASQPTNLFLCVISLTIFVVNFSLI